ncbi:MAG: DinB family protein [Bacteroidota bacterium]
MDKIFESTIFNRKVFIDILDELSLTQLNKIPQNFNNSIIWNIAHTLVTEQLLTYGLSGLPIQIDEQFVKRFRKGTKPTSNVTKEEIKYIKEHLTSIIDKTQFDYNSGVFQGFTSYLTSAKITLNNIEDAIIFNNYHEGIHLGVVLSLKKLVQ